MRRAYKAKGDKVVLIRFERLHCIVVIGAEVDVGSGTVFYSERIAERCLEVTIILREAVVVAIDKEAQASAQVLHTHIALHRNFEIWLVAVIEVITLVRLKCHPFHIVEHVSTHAETFHKGIGPCVALHILWGLSIGNWRHGRHCFPGLKHGGAIGDLRIVLKQFPRLWHQNGEYKAVVVLHLVAGYFDVTIHHKCSYLACIYLCCHSAVALRLLHIDAV